MSTQRVTLSTLSLQTIEGQTIDLLENFVSINVYEDIFATFLTGKLVLIDTVDLAQTIPIVGGELVTLTYKNSDSVNVRHLRFVVFKMNPQLITKDTMNSVRSCELMLISEEAVVDGLSSISRRFNDIGSNIVEDIVYNYLQSVKPIEIQSTANEIDFYSNFWRPSRAIQYITSRSQTETDLDMLFYEDMDGFKFKSLSSLLNGDSIGGTLYFDITNIDNLGDPSNIRSHIMSQNFDIVEEASRGAFGETVYQIDPERYGFTMQKQTRHDSTQYSVSLGNNVTYADDHNSDVNVVSITYNNGTIASSRRMLIENLSRYNWVVKLNGDSSRVVGSIFKVRFPNAVTRSEKINRLFDGNWIATRINHEIHVDGTLIQKINLVKNAFQNEDRLTEVNGRTNIK